MATSFSCLVLAMFTCPCGVRLCVDLVGDSNHLVVMILGAKASWMHVCGADLSKPPARVLDLPFIAAKLGHQKVSVNAAEHQGMRTANLWLVQISAPRSMVHRCTCGACCWCCLMRQHREGLICVRSAAASCVCPVIPDRRWTWGPWDASCCPTTSARPAQVTGARLRSCHQHTSGELMHLS